MTTLLDVRRLTVNFFSEAGTVTPVDDVSFQLARGETLALVGESGCGKSLTALSILQLLPRAASIGPGSTIELDGQDLVPLDEAALRAVRGARIAMIFQDPMTSLDPVYTAGSQITEAIRAHRDVGKRQARERALELLEEVGIPDPLSRFDQYPHELSGGMRQRVMIAIALSCEPQVLIADEPTTALDVTVQAQILEILDRLRRSHDMAVLLITHDLGIVAGRADRVAVMYAGRIIETAPTDRLFQHPAHPYTQALLASVPRLTGPLQRLSPIQGTVPNPDAWPAGCRFHPRCPYAFDRCQQQPPVRAVADGHETACWLESPQ
ncbi:MAG: ABC transporter ATP-binding protein [Gemmatimonadetes bacterium]|nr:ABC transporter ATP-binding protein [Gemmatimonadota bacterium]